MDLADPHPSPRQSDAEPLTGITLLYHPHLERVGERVLLPGLAAGEPVAVTRRDPVFSRPDGEPTGPIADPFVSRRALRLVQTERDIAIETPSEVALRVQGRAVFGDTLIRPSDLERGVILEVADRVVLMLHRISPWAPHAVPRLVGESAAIQRLRDQIRDRAPQGAPLLLCGAPGSGHDLVARCLHDLGPRRGRPLVNLNLSSLSDEDAQRELLDGPDSARARAGGGCVHLDQLDEASPDAQRLVLKLLASLDSLSEAGRAQAPRVLVSVGADVEEAVRTGRLLPELVGRLGADPLALPSLRERREDIARLVVHFLRQDLRAFGEPHRLSPPEAAAPLWFSPRLMARLVRAPWPGNVRQLRNFVRQVVIAGRGQSSIVPTPSLLAALEGRVGPTETGDTVEILDRPSAEPPDPAHLSFDQIVEALIAARGDLDEAALRLDVPPNGLRRRMETLGLT